MSRGGRPAVLPEDCIYVEDSVEEAFSKILKANGINKLDFSKETEEQVKKLCTNDLEDPSLVDRTSHPYITIDNDDSMDLDQAMYIYQGDGNITVSYALSDGNS